MQKFVFNFELEFHGNLTLCFEIDGGWRKASKQTRAMTFIGQAFFYSKSKAGTPCLAGDPDWRRYLSNFQDILDGFSWDGHRFLNVEMAFHYEKFKRTNKPEMRKLYIGKPERQTRLYSNAFPTNAAAKRFSGRKAMTENGVTLNVPMWNLQRVDVSLTLLKARWKQDPKFRRILMESKSNDIELVHFERGTLTRPPFWGAFRSRKTGEMIGQNMLGRQMMQLRDNATA
jgi:predicted NAD-dependent protein-ADP-ribosyltransferase YbiA (DUF1768 family)